MTLLFRQLHRQSAFPTQRGINRTGCAAARTGLVVRVGATASSAIPTAAGIPNPPPPIPPILRPPRCPMFCCADALTCLAHGESFMILEMSSLDH